MPDKFSKIYQNKIIGVDFFIKSQIPEVVYNRFINIIYMYTYILDFTLQ